MLDKSINNNFEKQLIKKGYTIYSDNWKSAMRMFQKKITDKNGTKYFMNVYQYNYKKQFNRVDLDDLDRYMFNVQFRMEKEKKDKTVDIDFSADFLPNKYKKTTKLKEAEDFFEKIWNDFGFDYYEKKQLLKIRLCLKT